MSDLTIFMALIGYVTCIWLAVRLLGWTMNQIVWERWPPPCPHGFSDWDDCPDCCH